MKNKTLAMAAIFVTISLIFCFFTGCSNKNKDDSLTVTDPEGTTYLAIENQNGEIMAGVTDADGNLYAAEIDKDGNVLADGNLYPVEDYTGTLPHNETTVVNIQQAPQSTHNFAGGEVVKDPSGTTEKIKLDNDKNSNKTTAASGNKTTKPSSDKDEPADNTDRLMAEKYQKLFASGNYYIEFTTEEEGMTEPITAAVKNGNIFMKTSLEGMNCNMIYQKEKDAVYVVMTDYRVYCKMPSDMMNELEMTAFAQIEEVEEVTVYNATIDGKECVCELYETKTGDVSIYYFYNKDLVRLDQMGADGSVGIMNITKVSSSVDDSLFELPKAYVPINLSSLDMGSDDKESKN